MDHHRPWRGPDPVLDCEQGLVKQNKSITARTCGEIYEIFTVEYNVTLKRVYSFILDILGFCFGHDESPDVTTTNILT